MTGPNILLDGPGAVIDVETRGAAAAEVEGAWRRHAQAALEAVGWADSELRCRRFPGGVTLAFSAPEDVLYAATQVNEWAWEAARAELGDAEAEPESLEKAAERLRAAIEEERNPRLIALRDAAQGRDVTFLTDDDVSSVGMGRGCRLGARDRNEREDDDRPPSHPDRARRRRRSRLHLDGRHRRRRPRGG
ncbi:MAG: hypothetical protein P8Y10_11725 [Gemmatimonadales bacterium]